MQLTHLLSNEEQAGASVISVSVDTAAQTRAVIEKIGAEGGDASKLIFLEDVDHRVIDRYGLLNSSYGIARPATFVIDKSGVVRWLFVEKSYQTRPTNEAILEVLRELQ